MVKQAGFMSFKHLDLISVREEKYLVSTTKDPKKLTFIRMKDSEIMLIKGIELSLEVDYVVFPRIKE